MHSRRNLLIAAGLLVVVGVVIVFIGSGSTEYVSIPSNPDPSISDLTGVEAAINVNDGSAPTVFLGYLLMWIGSLLAAGVIGHRIATRRSPSA